MSEIPHVYQNREDGHDFLKMHYCRICNGYYGVLHDDHNHLGRDPGDCACRIHREQAGLSREGDHGWILGFRYPTDEEWLRAVVRGASNETR